MRYKAHFRRLLKTLLGHLFFGLGLHRLFLSRFAVVIALHRVEDAIPRDPMTMPTDEFRHWCRYFTKYFQVVSPMVIVEKLERGQPFRGELALTFDDGYLDFHTQAIPVLESLGLTATVFACSDFVGSDTTPWWDAAENKHYPFMDWQQLRDAGERGFLVGSHGKTHAGIDQLAPQKIHEEIVLSKSVLERGLDRAVELYAYPYGEPGRMTEEARRIVQEAGYRACFGYGGLTVAGTDPFHIERICVNDWFSSPAHFGGHLVVLLLRRIIGG